MTFKVLSFKTDRGRGFFSCRLLSLDVAVWSLRREIKIPSEADTKGPFSLLKMLCTGERGLYWATISVESSWIIIWSHRWSNCLTCGSSVKYIFYFYDNTQEEHLSEFIWAALLLTQREIILLRGCTFIKVSTLTQMSSQGVYEFFNINYMT